MASDATFSIPKWLFKNSDGSPCEIKNAVVLVAKSATNSTIVAAVAGKKIRVLALTAISQDAAAMLISFKDGSAGAGKLYVTDPSTAAGARVDYPPSEIGHVDTSSGVGLFADAGAGAGVVVSVRYIEFS